jgi:hypothetical protein
MNNRSGVTGRSSVSSDDDVDGVDPDAESLKLVHQYTSSFTRPQILAEGAASLYMFLKRWLM